MTTARGLCRPLCVLFLAVLCLGALAASDARADSLQPVAALAAQYVGDIQDQYGSSDDPGVRAAALAAARRAQVAGDLPAAIAGYEKAIAAGESSVTVWLALADLQNRRQDYDHASAAAYNAFVAAPAPEDKAAALERLGRYQEKAQNPAVALEAYRESLRLAFDPRIKAHSDMLAESLRFRLIGRSVSTAGERPEICLTFHGALAQPGDVHYEDYVRLDPRPAELVFTVDGSNLCIGGVAFGTRYRATVLPGLPSAEGERLAKTETLDIAVGDSQPFLGFRSGSYVLPRAGSAGVPLYSVNLDKAALRLLRIGDRNIVQAIQRGSFLRALDNYDADSIARDSGEEIWKGTVEIRPERNKRVTTLVPVTEMIPAISPGIYVLIAQAADGSDDRWGYKATQWLIVTDLGLTTMSGSGGLDVFVRSLDSGRALGRITVKLYARDNEELGSAVTDRSGRATFAPGLIRGRDGRTASAVMAFRRDGDFAFLDLTRPAFDLSDRGVGGRLAPAAADAFLYSDRGIYRPGETVHLGALLRDPAGHALDGLPLTLRLLRPDEVEARRYNLAAAGAGGYALDIPISASARTGSWTVQAYVDPKGDPVGSASFLVEDVVPARIETQLSTAAKAIRPGEPTPVTLQSRYLYGAPGAGLLVKASVVVETDGDPAQGAWPGYVFGLADEKVEARTTALDDLTTDAKGQVALDMTPADLPDTPQPLKATLRTEVYEFGGRPVIKTLVLPIRNHARLIGLKPLFADGAVASGGSAGFDIVALDSNMAETAVRGLQYRLVPEQWDYQWFFKDGNWDYRVVTRDRPAAASGTLDLSPGKPGHLAFPVDWGYYRLETYDPATGAASSSRFYAGWGAAPGTGDTPDKLQVVADKPLYAAGDRAKILIKPPFVGEVLVAVATDHVIDAWTVDATPEGRTIEVPVDGGWGAGAYLLATAFRPGRSDQHGPGRAIGTAWLGLDPAAHSLRIAMALPADIRPRRAIDLPVEVAGVTEGKPAFLTLAAVDEGVLQLTDFMAPAPLDYYFGKRRLGVELRDLYGQLIDGREGRRGLIRQGGDAEALGSRGAPPEIKLVALYSGVVRLDGNGRARVHLQIPDYNGRLRLMAVAWDADKVGSAEAGLVVHDPVIASLAMPRFLAPGDTSRIAVSLQNVSGPAGDYRLRLVAKGAAELGAGAEVTKHLNAGGSATVDIPIVGRAIGEADIHMTLTDPDGVELAHDARLPLRAAQFPLLDRTVRRLQPGESLRLDAAALARFRPGTGELLASFSALPNLDVPTLLRRLDRYPYGCLEQTVSRALPLLYLSDVVRLWGGMDDAAVHDRIQKAVDRVFEMQRYDGGFALWSAGGEAEPWLSAYAMDFLTRAKGKGFDVPDVGYGNGLRWLADLAMQRDDEDSDTLSARAYALYVLTEAGTDALSPLRYMADNQLDQLPTALAKAEIGAALALRGDRPRAGDAFKAALAAFAREAGDTNWYGDYGGALRDGAAILALAAETKAPGVDLGAVLERVAALQANAAWLSTQEQSWLLLAAHAASGGAQMTLALDGVARPATEEPLYLRPGAAALDKGEAVKNIGTAPVWARVSMIGVPAQDLPAAGEGFDIRRNYYTPDGEPADLSKIRQSDVLVAVIEGRRRDGDPHKALVVDLLPAGFEIENQRLSGSRKTDELSWLGDLATPAYAEFRDDRYVAAIDLDEDKGDFRLAYLVRAVTPGSYRLPAASVEDMYRPGLRARTAMGQVTIAPYQGAGQ